eukprot:Skav235377  [mRNA]  locus=scaffold59:244863:246083:- [translate_table: standard]
MYVDDALAFFPRSSAPLCASILLCLAVALGVPLSWHKLRLGFSLKWIGWDLHLQDKPYAALPLDKQDRLRAALAPMCHPGAKIERKALEKLLGLLCWFTSGVHWLRPWLFHLFHLLHQPVVRFKALDATQLEELSKCMTHAAITVQPKLSDLQVGWTCLSIGNATVEKPQDVLLAPLKNGQAWVRFGDKQCSSIKVSSAAAKACAFYRKIVELQTKIFLREVTSPHIPAAADAFAEASVAGIGGWWLPQGKSLQPEHIKWFSIQITADELPDWFLDKCADLSKHICALEGLAQLVLSDLLLAEQDVGKHFNGRLVLRQDSDNQGVVGATARGLSMKPDVAGVLQALAWRCAREQVAVKVSHIAGDRNDWADALSRGRGHLPSFWARLSAEGERRCQWQDLLASGRL